MKEFSGIIQLVPLSLDIQLDMHSIIDRVRSQFHNDLKLHEIKFDLSQYFNPDRLQYSANEILPQLVKNAAGADKIIGITSVDIYIPVLTFIFGQAYLGGQAGIVSVYRLRNEFYGMEENEILFRERMIKTVIHELGHMFGLMHCMEMKCVMRSVTYVEDIDQKTENLCPKCAGLIV